MLTAVLRKSITYLFKDGFYKGFLNSSVHSSCNIEEELDLYRDELKRLFESKRDDLVADEAVKIFNELEDGIQGEFKRFRARILDVFERSS